MIGAPNSSPAGMSVKVPVWPVVAPCIEDVDDVALTAGAALHDRLGDRRVVGFRTAATLPATKAGWPSWVPPSMISGPLIAASVCGWFVNFMTGWLLPEPVPLGAP